MQKSFICFCINMQHNIGKDRGKFVKQNKIHVKTLKNDYCILCR